MSDEYRQNDPDRAGGLISDAQGEFATSESGGAFDPRAFTPSSEHPAQHGDDAPERPDAPAAEDEERIPPMNDERMSSPGGEIEKAG
jgi:hypothetical protein